MPRFYRQELYRRGIKRIAEYVIGGDLSPATYRNGIKRIAEYVLKESLGKFIFMYPTLSAGADFAEDVGRVFKQNNAGYETVPFLVDRLTDYIVKPTWPDLSERLSNAPQPPFHFIFDDTTCSGRTVYTFYAFLLSHGVPDEGIVMCSLLDRTGSLNYAMIPACEARVPREQQLANLKRNGKVPQEPVAADVLRIYAAGIQLMDYDYYRRHPAGVRTAPAGLTLPEVPVELLKELLR